MLIFFFILEKDVMSLSMYAEISRVLNIFHCGKPDHGSNFFYWLQSQSYSNPCVPRVRKA